MNNSQSVCSKYNTFQKINFTLERINDLKFKRMKRMMIFTYNKNKYFYSKLK